jgi:hypothetical protein
MSTSVSAAEAVAQRGDSRGAERPALGSRDQRLGLEALQRALGIARELAIDGARVVPELAQLELKRRGDHLDAGDR